MELPFAVTDTDTPTDTAPKNNYEFAHFSAAGQHYSAPVAHSTSTESSISAIAPTPTLAVLPSTRTMYDNVRLSYFTPPSSTTITNLQPEAQSLVSPFYRDTDSIFKTQDFYDDEDDEDFYVAVDEDSFISLSTQHRSSPHVSHNSKNNNPPTIPSRPLHTEPSLEQKKEREDQRFDILTLLLDSSFSHSGTLVQQLCEQASHEATAAFQATRSGDLASSVLHHIQASRLFREGALRVKYPQGPFTDHTHFSTLEHPTPMSSPSGNYPVTLVYNLLLLCQTHAQHADSLLKSGAVFLGDEGIQSYWKFINKKQQDPTTESSFAVVQKETSTHHLPEDRLRATIRASMTRKKEVDMTESTFLGVPSCSTTNIHTTTVISSQIQHEPNPISINTHDSKQQVLSKNQNPIDDMMKLEKELRDMDMTIDLGVGVGNSIASLTDMSHVNTLSTKDPDVNYGLLSSSPGMGASYMSSSSMWASHSVHMSLSSTMTTTPHGGSSTTPINHTIISNPIPGRGGRTDRMKSTTTHPKTSHTIPHRDTTSNIPPKCTTAMSTSINSTYPHAHTNLDTSWWGHASILASSTVSLGNSIVGIKSPSNAQGTPLHSSSIMIPNTVAPPSSSSSSSYNSPSVTTKQLLRLLDTIRTLGDENASLLREVENAKKAQMEAKATREAMKVFQEEYGKRFSTLKLALEQYKRENPTQQSHHPIQSSSFVASEAELRKKDLEIEKLNAQLRKEKEDGKKRDNALRKYETFYKEVKARSAQKAKQREEEQTNKMCR